MLEKCSTNLATPTDHFLEPVCLSQFPGDGFEYHSLVYYIYWSLIGLMILNFGKFKVTVPVSGNSLYVES